jgi:hypothetical protein
MGVGFLIPNWVSELTLVGNRETRVKGFLRVWLTDNTNPPLTSSYLSYFRVAFVRLSTIGGDCTCYL